MKDIVTVNGFELPVIKTDRSIFSYSYSGIKYSFIKEDVFEVLHIDANFTYETNYYYNLFDSKGNIIKTDNKRNIEHVRCCESVNIINSFGGNNIILFLKGEFRLLTIDNCSINTIDELDRFNKILNSTYKTYSDVNSNDMNYKLDYVPNYNIIRGHSRVIYGILSRQDIQMTYKDLQLKIKKSKELFKDKIKYDIDADFLSMEREIIKGITTYLMLTEKQYKAGRFNLITQLNKRLNYNINNKK
tara:strand:+ start:220 stop:954 length:735 start_codon:yes stop_codon:yes gene_type:complete